LGVLTRCRESWCSQCTQWDRRSGCFCQSIIIIIDNTCHGVEDDVFKNGTEADGVENIGFLLSGQANALSIASTLDVEDTSVTPAVLIVANQGTLRIGREGRLAGA